MIDRSAVLHLRPNLHWKLHRTLPRRRLFRFMAQISRNACREDNTDDNETQTRPKVREARANLQHRHGKTKPLVRKLGVRPLLAVSTWSASPTMEGPSSLVSVSASVSVSADCVGTGERLSTSSAVVPKSSTLASSVFMETAAQAISMQASQKRRIFDASFTRSPKGYASRELRSGTATYIRPVGRRP